VSVVSELERGKPSAQIAYERDSHLLHIRLMNGRHNAAKFRLLQNQKLASIASG
jgi:hypothetical protein